MEQTNNYSANGQSWTQYQLSVSNALKFPDSLFSPSPDLAPCGFNENASRSWVNIYDLSDKYIYGFCALTSAEELSTIWFALPQGECPPEAVYIQIEDRKCGFTYESNLLDLSDYCPLPNDTMQTDTACKDLAIKPILELGAIEDYSANGEEWTSYGLIVNNSVAFPDSLFRSAPDLASCGLNDQSAQTWVDIYNGQHQRIYGFCALEKAEDLQKMWFAVSRGECPPETIYIIITDRRCNLSYTSNFIDLSNYCEKIATKNQSNSFFVPSGITPNGDGLNDNFVIPELRNHPEQYPNAEVVLFNRWGDIIFQAKPYINNWSGQNQKDGKPLPVGTYFYIVRLNIGEGMIRQGEVTIFR